MTALVTGADLAGFPGAPFTDAVADAAGESVRDEAGWHIAPEVTETLTVWSEGGVALLLPSLRVVSVSEIRDVTGDTSEVLTGWEDRGSGILYRATGWPVNRRLEVDLVHGHTTVPKALLPVIAHRAQATKITGLSNVRLGSLSIGSGAGDTADGDDATIRRYSL